MRKRLLPTVLALGLLLSAVTLFARPPITVTGAWIRLLPGDLPLAGYFTLHNGGAKAITLVGASGQAFERIELHHSMTMQGMDKMTPVAEVTIPAGKTFTFAPGGYHLMLWRRRELRIGEKIPITLKLADGRELHAVFTVQPATHD